MMKNTFVLEELGKNVLLKAKNHFDNYKNLSDEILTELHSIYGKTAENALDIIDKGKIIKYQSESGTRCFYLVIGKEEHFPIYEGINFCFCNDFRGEVLTKNVQLRRSITCCHVLAVEIAKITENISETKNIKEDAFIEMLNSFHVENP